MKKFIIVALCSLMTSGMPANTTTISDKTDISTTVEISNPFVECASIEDTAKIAGFGVVLPTSLPLGYEKTSIQAIKDNLIDIRYKNADNELIIRKGLGTEDISGDYNVYTNETVKDISGNSVTLNMKGDKIFTAQWNDGTYSFAISCDFNSNGFDLDTMSKLISELK